MAADQRHDIFLSYSTEQKGFVRDLHDKLSSMGYSVFFDQDPRSLQPGQASTHLINSAVHTCKLAIVVLSDDYFVARSGMTELCAFADRLSSHSQADHSSRSPDTFILLPLFLQMSSEDLTSELKLQQWRKTWESFDLQDDNACISVKKCEEAIGKLLDLNGIARKPASEEGETSYIDSVADGVFSILPPIKRFTLTPNKHYSGRERLCNIILDKFQQLEQQPHPSQSDDVSRNACIVGMFGADGSGKSTLSRFLCESMYDEFLGNVAHYELPTKLYPHRFSQDYLNFSSLCAELLYRFTPWKDVASADANELLNLLRQARSRKRIFLVLDNISQSNYESCAEIVEAILDSGILEKGSLEKGSRILLVAKSDAILERLLRCRFKQMYRYAATEVPCFTKALAMDRCIDMQLQKSHALPKH